LNSVSGVVVVKNEDYWNADNVDISKVDAKIIKELDTAVNLYESGELDETIIASEYVTEYKGKPELITNTQFATGWLQPNFDVPLFQNENIRKALQLGLNREAANNKILNNGSEPATGLVPPVLAGPGKQSFREAEGPVMPAYDPEEAKKLFQKGVEEVGENLEFELLAEDSSVVRDIATLFQSDLKKMGAKVSVNLQPFSSRLQLEADGKFQMVITAWLADYNDPMTFLDYFESISPYNTFNYKNARYDELIGGAKEETDAAKRMDMLLEAEKVLVAEDAAISPWRFYGQAYLVRPDKIKKYVEQPYGGGKDYSLWKLA
jgi:oligopeptide transport system substrate-binding protein